MEKLFMTTDAGFIMLMV